MRHGRPRPWRADDGYAVYSSLAAIAALNAQGVALPRCVLLIGACDKSGSLDLPAHLQALGSRISTPSLVVCLDAEYGDYERGWGTTSLRGQSQRPADRAHPERGRAFRDGKGRRGDTLSPVVAAAGASKTRRPTSCSLTT